MKAIIKLIAVICVLIFMSAAMTGCKTVYVPVESFRTEHADKLTRDSIYLKDSIYIRDVGDTVFVNRYVTKYVDRIQVDSFCRVDSIPKPYPVEVIKEVKKPPNWWQQALSAIGAFALGFAVFWVIRKIKR